MSCLTKWRLSHTRNSNNYRKCELCNYKFKYYSNKKTFFRIYLLPLIVFIITYISFFFIMDFGSSYQKLQQRQQQKMLEELRKKQMEERMKKQMEQARQRQMQTIKQQQAKARQKATLKIK